MGKDTFARTSYLALLGMRMRGALRALGARDRTRHTEAILSFQTSGGGFRGRRGLSDLYYTGFAVRGLFALGQRASGKTKAYLQQQQTNNIIDQVSMLNCLLLQGERGYDTEQMFEFLESFKARDGGYAKTRSGEFGSTYHTFLAVLCYDLFGETAPDVDGIAEFLRSRRRDDGGFCDSPAAKQSNTNATAAGTSLSTLLGLCDNDLTGNVTDYLLRMRHSTGGWTASKQAPFPDLLSTYTAILTLDIVGALERGTAMEAFAFAAACEGKTGGFMAGPWDDQVDVEYTYYGLGVVSLALERRLS